MELFASQWTKAPEDCVQDAFIQLVRQPRSPDCVVAWLFRVVRNRAICMKRSADRRMRHELAASAARPAWFTTKRNGPIDTEAFGDALRTLSEQHREVIVARIWGGFPLSKSPKLWELRAVVPIVITKQD